MLGVGDESSKRRGFAGRIMHGRAQATHPTHSGCSGSRDGHIWGTGELQFSDQGSARTVKSFIPGLKIAV